jgi:hypothetical protein
MGLAWNPSARSMALRAVSLGLATLALTSCGGGGGSSSSGPTSTGRYVGTANTTLAGPTGSTPVVGGIQFVVGADGTVTVSNPGQGQPPFGTGTLSGSAFTVTAPGSIANSPGINCVGTITFNGTISGTTMSGDVSSSNFRCNGVPFTLTGSFSATLLAQLPTRPAGGGFGDTLKRAVAR